MPHFEWFSNTVSSRGDEALRAKNAPLHNNAARPSRSINFAQWQILKKLPKRTTSVQQPFWLLLSNALLGSSFLRKIAQEIANLVSRVTVKSFWMIKVANERFCVNALFSILDAFSFSLVLLCRNVENLLLWFSGSENQVKMQVDTNGFVTISSQIITLILSGQTQNQVHHF